jgi:hypothetical protein
MKYLQTRLLVEVLYQLQVIFCGESLREWDQICVANSLQNYAAGSSEME